MYSYVATIYYSPISIDKLIEHRYPKMDRLKFATMLLDLNIPVYYSDDLEEWYVVYGSLPFVRMDLYYELTKVKGILKHEVSFILHELLVAGMDVKSYIRRCVDEHIS